MKPSQISLLAEKLRGQNVPPIATMRPSEYAAASAIFALSHALDAVAEEVGVDAPTEGRPEPYVDEAMLRRDALDQAARVATGRETQEQLVQRAQAFEAFLRGDAGAPPARTGRLIGGAPVQVHESIDRLWSSVEEHDNGTIVSNADDEDVLELLRQISDEELRRTSFIASILRRLLQAASADRRA